MRCVMYVLCVLLRTSYHGPIIDGCATFFLGKHPCLFFQGKAYVNFLQSLIYKKYSYTYMEHLQNALIFIFEIIADTITSNEASSTSWGNGILPTEMTLALFQMEMER